MSFKFSVSSFQRLAHEAPKARRELDLVGELAESGFLVRFGFMGDGVRVENCSCCTAFPDVLLRVSLRRDRCVVRCESRCEVAKNRARWCQINENGRPLTYGEFENVLRMAVNAWNSRQRTLACPESAYSEAPRRGNSAELEQKRLMEVYL